LQLFDWNLVYCFVVKIYSSSSRFGVIDSFLQELCHWNLEEFKRFSVFRTFCWPYLQLYDWNLVCCFVVKSSSSSSHFGVFDLIFIRPSKDGTYYVMALAVRGHLQFSGLVFARIETGCIAL
jgi:hypothetical protein